MYLKNYNVKAPDSILVLEDSRDYTIKKHEHFVFRISSDGDYCIDFFNGKDNRISYARYSESDMYRMFFSGLKYKEFSLNAFNKIKAFL